MTHDLGQIRKGLGPVKMVLVEDPVASAGPEGPERRTDLREILKAVDSLVAGLAEEKPCPGQERRQAFVCWRMACFVGVEK